MDEFRLMATVLSMVLGLGVTRLLLALVTVFRIRRQSPIDWLPLAWAGIIFITQLQFWWAITRLPSMGRAFTFADFIFLVSLTLMLFLAAVLLLPTRAEDEKYGLRPYFEQDGRYALLAFAAYLALGFVANIVFFNAPLLDTWSVLDVPLILFPAAIFWAKSRRVKVWITLAYIPLMVADIPVWLR